MLAPDPRQFFDIIQWLMTHLKRDRHHGNCPVQILK